MSLSCGPDITFDFRIPHQNIQFVDKVADLAVANATYLTYFSMTPADGRPVINPSCGLSQFSWLLRAEPNAAKSIQAINLNFTDCTSYQPHWLMDVLQRLSPHLRCTKTLKITAWSSCMKAGSEDDTTYNEFLHRLHDIPFATLELRQCKFSDFRDFDNLVIGPRDPRCSPHVRDLRLYSVEINHPVFQPDSPARHPNCERLQLESLLTLGSESLMSDTKIIAEWLEYTHSITSLRHLHTPCVLEPEVPALETLLTRLPALRELQVGLRFHRSINILVLRNSLTHLYLKLYDLNDYATGWVTNLLHAVQRHSLTMITVTLPLFSINQFQLDIFKTLRRFLTNRVRYREKEAREDIVLKKTIEEVVFFISVAEGGLSFDEAVIGMRDVFEELSSQDMQIYYRNSADGLRR